MTHQKMFVWCLACVVIDQIGARLLDSIGLVEGLLAPNGARLLLLVPLSFVFYGARLASYFVVPGLLLVVAGAVVVANLRAWRDKCACRQCQRERSLQRTINRASKSPSSGSRKGLCRLAVKPNCAGSAITGSSE